MGWSKFWAVERYDGKAWQLDSGRQAELGLCSWGIELPRERGSLGFRLNTLLEERAHPGVPDDASAAVRECAERAVLRSAEELLPQPHGFAWIAIEEILTMDLSKLATDQNASNLANWLDDLRALTGQDRTRLVFWWTPP